MFTFYWRATLAMADEPAANTPNARQTSGAGWCSIEATGGVLQLPVVRNDGD